MRRGIFGMLVLLILCAPVRALNYQLELGQAELQRGLERLFPVSKNDPLISIFLRDPRILLQNGRERIGLRADMVAEMPGGVTASGDVAVDGKLRYEARGGAFYLDQARIGTLHIEGVPQSYTEQIRAAVEPIVRELLATNPIYTIGGDDRASALASQQIKSVTVRNGKVFVELAGF